MNKRPLPPALEELRQKAEREGANSTARRDFDQLVGLIEEFDSKSDNGEGKAPATRACEHMRSESWVIHRMITDSSEEWWYQVKPPDRVRWDFSPRLVSDWKLVRIVDGKKVLGSFYLEVYGGEVQTLLLARYCKGCKPNPIDSLIAANGLWNPVEEQALAEGHDGQATIDRNQPKADLKQQLIRNLRPARDGSTARGDQKIQVNRAARTPGEHPVTRITLTAHTGSLFQDYGIPNIPGYVGFVYLFKPPRGKPFTMKAEELAPLLLAARNSDSYDGKKGLQVGLLRLMAAKCRKKML